VIGGIGQVIEIDEYKFGRRKYNREHRVDGQWIFGGVQRETGSCFLIPVEKRDKDTLHQSMIGSYQGLQLSAIVGRHK